MEPCGLIGREALLAELSGVITTVGGGGDAVLLAGERGIGKTACLLAVQEVARASGVRVVGTVGSEGESALGFAGLHRLLQPLFGLVDVLPVVQRRALLTAVGMSEGPPPDPFAVSLAVLGLVIAASADRPLLMTVDDFQWVDEVSRSVLAFVARRLGRSQVVIIAASSWADAPSDLADLFREVRLERLDEGASHALLWRCAPGLGAAHRDWVLGRAVGNPLALVELAATSASAFLRWGDPADPIIPMSPVLVDAFADRLSGLVGPVADVVLVAALATDGDVQEILAATALLSGAVVTTAVLEIPRSLGLFVHDDMRVRFAHPLVRSAVAGSESVNRRQAAHRALGETIVVNSHRRTWHRANGAAGRDDTIASELECSSSVSVRRGDLAWAITTLERAAQLSTMPAERGRRLLLAAKQAADLGSFDTVDRLLAVADGDRLSEFDRVRADLLRGHRDDAATPGESARVLHLCSMAQRALGAGEDDLALKLAYAVGVRRFSAPLSPRADAAVIALAGSVVRDRTTARALAVLAVADPVRHGRTIVSALARLHGTARGDAESLHALADAACAVGDYKRGLELLDRAEAALRRRGLRGALAPVLLAGAVVRLDVGDWDRAASALAEIGAPAGHGRTVGSADVLATAAKAAALRGDTARALRLVTEAQHCPAIRRGSSALARAQIALGIAHLSSGRHQDAFTALSRVFDPKDPSHHFREQFGAVMYLAEAASRAGREGEARPVIERMGPVAERSGSPLLDIHLRYARAVLAAGEAAEGLFLDCLASDLATWAWPRARVQLAYGRWLRRRRHVKRSRGPLRSAHVVFEELGASRWAREALDELAATGHRHEGGYAEASAVLLTAQELKVARLAAEGLSNTEIGRRLGLSPRTVGSHLYRVFPKLEVSARGQIAARLLRGVASGSL